MKIKMGRVKELMRIISKAKENPESVFDKAPSVTVDDTNEQILQPLDDDNRRTCLKRKKEDEPDCLETKRSKSNQIRNVDVSLPGSSKQFVGEKVDGSDESENDSCLKKGKKEENQEPVNPYKFTQYGTVEKTLKAYKQDHLIQKMQDVFTDSHRKAMLRILVKEMIQTQKTAYPPDETKSELAKAIVREFPKLKNERSRLGYEHYYDPQNKTHNFIHYSLQNIQKRLPPEEKKYKKGSEKPKTGEVPKDVGMILSDDQLSEKVTWMKHKYPSQENRVAITEVLGETFATRRHWILNTNPSTTEIIEKYNRLLDFKGSMIDDEFDRIFPELGDKLISKFGSYYVPRIKNYAGVVKTNLIEKHDYADDDLAAACILVELLPVCNSVKGKGVGKGKGKKSVDANINAVDMLIQTVTVGTDLAGFVAERRAKSSTSIQPYMICVGGEDLHFYVIVDSNIINRADRTDFVSAFDLLCKTFYVFNLEYPAPLKNFFNFFEVYVYEISSCKVTSSAITSLHINLTNVKV